MRMQTIKLIRPWNLLDKGHTLTTYRGVASELVRQNIAVEVEEQASGQPSHNKTSKRTANANRSKSASKRRPRRG
ncbi:MAG: hypothetical protein DHS20C16_03500 [Phycisphaerae bacterium]|nr:MAG: hypothetical protein DHS20C16_03500 [Phycisphaerae bacterium]